MKAYLIPLFFAFCITLGNAQENETPQFTGDNFSLEGALSMFKKSNSLEDFEKALNEENNNVNNLDLNADGDIDYIGVDDVMENNNHVIILKALVGENEQQDVATINIEKTGNEDARLQIIGDEDLYSEDYVIEPFDTNEKVTPSKGPAMMEINLQRIVVNVWAWPCVRFVYSPNYSAWMSPVRWARYPRWWKPWRPYRHTLFINRCNHHRAYFHRAPRVVRNSFYRSRRHTSTVIVKNRRGNTTIHRGRGGHVRAGRRR